MFNNLKRSIIFPIITTLALLMAFIFANVTTSRNQLTDNFLYERAYTVSGALYAYFEHIEEQVILTSRMMARSHTLANYVNDLQNGGVTYEAQDAIMEYLIELKLQFDTCHFIIADAQGRAILRSHANVGLDFFNPDYPHLLTLSLEEGRARYHFGDSMVMKLVSATPVVHQNETIGTVIAIRNIGVDNFVDTVSQILNAEITVFFGDERVATTVLAYGRRAIGTAAPEGVAEIVLGEGRTTLSQAILGGVAHTAYYFPLLGENDEVIGMLAVGFSTEFVSSINAAAHLEFLITALASLVIVAVIMYLLISRAIKPLRSLTRDAMKVAAGNMDVEFTNAGQKRRKDEIGAIYNAFGDVVATLDILHDNLRRALEAIEHGDISYRLDDSVMEGAFAEILAESNAIINEFNKLLELLSEPIIIIGKDFKVKYANQALLNYIPKKDYRGLHVNDLLNFDVAGHPAVVKGLETGTPQLETEMQSYLNPRQLSHFNFNFIPFWAGSSKTDPAGAILLMVDITRIKTIMQREEEIAKLNRVMLDAMPLLVEFWDEYTGIFDCNRQTLVTYGLESKEEYITNYEKNYPEYQPCGMLSKEKIAAHNEIAMQDGYSRFEFMDVISNGEALPLETICVRVNLHDGPVIIHFSHDLRMLQNEAIKAQKSEERARLLLKSLPVACILLNSKYELIDCNKTALSFFLGDPKGSAQCFTDDPELARCVHSCDNCHYLKMENCAGREYFSQNYLNVMLNTTEERALEIVKLRCEAAVKVASEGGLYQFEGYTATLFENAVPCEITVVPVQMQEEIGYSIYVRSTQEEKLRQAAEEESHSKTRFLAHMSHEVRTPLNSILGIAEINLQKENHLPETEEAFLRIFNSSKLLLSIINDILDLSKVEAGKMEIIPTTYDLSSLIMDSAQLLNILRFEGKNIAFSLHVDENLPAFLIGDELRIKQIVINLLSNAFKYTKDGTVDLRFSAVRAEEALERLELLIEVEDTGQGMTQEQIERIFTMEYLRHNEDVNRHIEGSGLGLPIVYKLIQLMDGSVAVDSLPGKGSTFTVRLPQKIDGPHILGKDTAKNLESLYFDKQKYRPASRINRDYMPYGRVLVVDDMESNLYVARQMLLPYKLQIQTVLSGAEAIERVENGEVYDIIFMDHMMPGMDGMETTKRLRLMGYQGPIVALTANTVKGMKEMFLNNGFSSFLSKPVDLSEMDKYLRRYIRDKQTPEVLEAAKIEALLDAASDDSAINTIDLTKSFLLDAKKTVSNLEFLLENRDWSEDFYNAFALQAHNIKGALANIGRMSFSDEAAVLEEAGRNEDIDNIRRLAPDFIDSLKRLMAALAPKEFEIAYTAINEEDKQTLRSLLDMICVACEAFDVDEANRLLEAVRGLPLTREIKIHADEIAACLLHGAFDEATYAVEEMRQSI